jgi:MFS family permease
MPSNITRVTLVYFCARFHLYVHVSALLLQSRGLTLPQISLIESVVIGTIFLMEVPTGVVADRIGRKWSLTASTLLMMCGELIFLFSRSYPLYMLMAVVTGTGFAFASGATEALIYDSLPTEGRDDAMKRAMGRYNSVGQIAFFFGPILGGLVLGDLTPERFHWAIGLTVLTLVVGAFISLTVHEPPSPWHAERHSALAIFRTGVAELRGNRRLQRFVLLATFTAPFTGALLIER